MSLELILSMVGLLVLCFVQNIAFSLVSRSRNRNHKGYLIACSIFSNGVFFATLGILVKSDLDPIMAIPYIIGSVSGSVVGTDIAIYIEKKLGVKM